MRREADKRATPLDPTMKAPTITLALLGTPEARAAMVARPSAPANFRAAALR